MKSRGRHSGSGCDARRDLPAISTASPPQHPYTSVSLSRAQVLGDGYETHNPHSLSRGTYRKLDGLYNGKPAWELVGAGLHTESGSHRAVWYADGHWCCG